MLPQSKLKRTSAFGSGVGSVVTFFDSKTLCPGARVAETDPGTKVVALTRGIKISASIVSIIKCPIFIFSPFLTL
jgi:hypothetical protein